MLAMRHDQNVMRDDDTGCGEQTGTGGKRETGRKQRTNERMLSGLLA